MFKKISLTFLLIVNFTLSQVDIPTWVKSEFIKNSRKFDLLKVNYPGDQRYDVKYYKLDLRINHIQQKISGNVRIDAVVDTINLNSIFIDLANTFTVDSIKMNNNILQYNRVSDRIFINFGSSFNRGQKFSIIIYYNGTPSNSGFGSFTFGTRAG
ncbi:MAG: hypothetical protein N2043_13195, partial [Ignavibacterium sp.]|nr:hypothetical protein [Ignavibacterium sp.]